MSFNFHMTIVICHMTDMNFMHISHGHPAADKRHMFRCIHMYFQLLWCYYRGKGDYYRLGHSDDSHQRLPKRVRGPLTDKIIVDIACGSLHCVCCTKDGEVYTWGDNDEGQIGNNSTTPVQGPQVSQCV